MVAPDIEPGTFCFTDKCADCTIQACLSHQTYAKLTCFKFLHCTKEIQISHLVYFLEQNN